MLKTLSVNGSKQHKIKSIDKKISNLNTKSLILKTKTFSVARIVYLRYLIVELKFKSKTC